MTSLLSNLRIWLKALIPLTATALVAAVLTFMLVRTLDETEDKYNHLLTHEGPAAVWATRMGASVIDLSRLTWRAIADENSNAAAETQELQTVLVAYRDRAAKTSAMLTGNALAAKVPGYLAAFEALHRHATEALALSHAGRNAEAARLDANVGAVRTQSIVIACASIALVLLLGIWMSLKGIVAPVRALTATMDTLAAGRLDTTVAGTQRADELGTMARSVETFRQGLQEVERLKAEQQAAEARTAADQRAAMNGLADRFQASIGHVVESLSSASTELTAAAGSMASIADETSRQATTVASASEQATANVQTVASAAEELSSSVAEISRQVAQSTQIAGQAMGEVAQTNETVQGLTTSVSRISEVVRLISEIASQTNLLALNATIEAARAGDAGKGFAVVASEVKHLATQTARATEDISGRISEIQGATTQSVAAIGRINAVIQQMSEISLAIASAVEEQGAATQEIARNVAEAADGTQLVSSNILAVTQASAETGTAASQVQASSAEVAQQADGLKHQVETFLQQVRAA